VMGDKNDAVEEDGDGETSIPLLPLRAATKEKNNSCILVVGTTGTGKTSTVNIYTGNNLKVGHSAHAETGETITVEDKNHPGAPAWIDNPGWSDTEGRSDAIVFKDLLKHMQTSKLHKVAAVVWCVLPQIRMDSVLQAQARFIDMFTDKGRIWSNVIILCKGKGPAESAAEDCKGAVMAAKKANVHAEPRTVGYQFATAKVLAGASEEFRREELRSLTDPEIREKLEAELSSLPPSIQVVFANKRCQACGQTGDPRLMEDTCHRGLKKGHIGALKQRFSKAQTGAAVTMGAVGIVGLSVAAALASEFILLGLPLVMGPGAVMSTHRFLNTGSRANPPCGGLKITDMRYRCCGMQELAEGGCTDLCDKCGAKWGEKPPGCVMIRHPDSGMQSSRADYEVVVKDHDLIDIKT